MLRRLTLLVLTGILIGHTVPTIAAPAQAGAEIKRLDAFVGKWRLDVDIKATATTQAFAATGTEDCELFANMHVVCQTDAGAYRSMRTMSFVPAVKQYGAYTVDSYGYTLYSLGTEKGGTWTFSSEAGGYKARVTFRTTRDSYTATSEYAGPDGKWVTTSVTKAARIK